MNEAENYHKLKGNIIMKSTRGDIERDKLITDGKIIKQKEPLKS